MTVKCRRCGVACAAQQPGKSNARPFRKAVRGFCAACVVCRFFQGDENTGVGHALPPDFDPEGLRLPHIQEQFARVLAVGGSELTMDQINWDEVIAKWNLPIATR